MSTTATPSSNSNGANDISLSKQLAEIDGLTNYPATDLLKELLKFHQADVEHKRNIHMSAQVIRRSRVAYEEINSLITKVDETMFTDQQELDYASWDKYTEAIPSLEDVLLKYYFKYSNKARKHVPDDEEDVQGGISFLHTWVADRELLDETLTTLKHQNLLTLSDSAKMALEAAYEDHRMQDDKASLEALFVYLKRFDQKSGKLTDRDIYGIKRGDKPVTSVYTEILNIAGFILNKPYVEGLTFRVIKTFILLVIPFSLLDKTRSPKLKKLEASIREHLASLKVWSTMKVLTTATMTLLNASDADQQAKIQGWEQVFEELSELLLSVGQIFINLAGDMLDLIKISARIRSPFHERTVGLVRILRHLDVDTNKAPADHRRQLQETMRTAFDTLTEASKAINKDITKLVLEDQEYKSRAGQMQTLLDTVQKTNTEIKLEAKWTERVALFNSGVQTDEDHLERMKAMYAAASAPAVTTST